MLVSPFTFYRGAALVMASDLAGTPNSGLRAQLCGDAHMSNFGVFGSPERHLVFDANDFDETAPGPFEWDIKRLVASLEIAGARTGSRPSSAAAWRVAAGAAYREAMRNVRDPVESRRVVRPSGHGQGDGVDLGAPEAGSGQVDRGRPRQGADKDSSQAFEKLGDGRGRPSRGSSATPR